ncbi:MAG: type II toxin-antitoxin system VapC family toxin [bacterium]|nr:type II toxin-antitoxin system VapC family toxin [bacterium]
MRYWDASALVPLIVSESGTDQTRSWLASDSEIVTWAWTRVEITSALERRTREGALSRDARRIVLDRLNTFADTWDEVAEILAVRSQTGLLLARHPLRAADAGQLGAALLVQEQLGGFLEFLSLDRRLSEAAELEGLRVA